MIIESDGALEKEFSVIHLLRSGFITMSVAVQINGGAEYALYMKLLFFLFFAVQSDLGVVDTQS